MSSDIGQLYSTQPQYAQEQEGAFSERELIPIIGTCKAIFDICQKASMREEDVAGNHYYEFLKDTSYFTLIIYTIPILGNTIAAFSYYRRSVNITNKAHRLSQLNNADAVETFLDNLKSWEKAAVAERAVAINSNVYIHLSEQVKLRYEVAIQAMQTGVDESHIAWRSRNDRDLMCTAVHLLGIHLKYASEALRSEDFIVESYLKRRYDMKHVYRATIHGQLQSLPTEMLGKLLGKEFFPQRTVLNMPQNEVLEDLGQTFIHSLSVDDQKKLLSKIICGISPLNKTHDNLIEYFPRSVVREFLHENRNHFQTIYTEKMNRILHEGRPELKTAVV